MQVSASLLKAKEVTFPWVGYIEKLHRFKKDLVMSFCICIDQ